MLEVAAIIIFFIVFVFMYEKDQKDRERQNEIIKTFENTLSQVFTSVEKTNTKFYDMSSRIEIEHFKQLEKQSDKQMKLFDKSLDKFLTLLEEKEKKDREVEMERIKPISEETNSIETSPQDQEMPLDDFPHLPLGNVNVQFEGEEEILPITIS